MSDNVIKFKKKQDHLEEKVNKLDIYLKNYLIDLKRLSEELKALRLYLESVDKKLSLYSIKSINKSDT